MNDKVVMFDHEDPAMDEASKKARENFRYFWRELHWEYRRIVPALDIAAVKVAFTDSNVPADVPDTEHMWISDISFDGQYVYGTLISSPNWVKTVSEGDNVRVPLGQISDWIYAIHGKAYGGFTVNLMRSGMDQQELREHDEAWGLDFGDPGEVEIVPVDQNESLDEVLKEHPACINMVDQVKELVNENPGIVIDKDDNGWTMLHLEALAGSTSIVRELINHGANPSDKNNDGESALDLAIRMDWQETADVMRTPRLG